MKAILVIDIEEDIDIKTLRVDFEVYGDIRIKPYYQYRKGVELKPIPETRDVGYPNDDYDVGYGDGWDACLYAITGETK